MSDAGPQGGVASASHWVRNTSCGPEDADSDNTVWSKCERGVGLGWVGVGWGVVVSAVIVR